MGSCPGRTTNEKCRNATYENFLEIRHCLSQRKTFYEDVHMGRYLLRYIIIVLIMAVDASAASISNLRAS